MYREKRGMETIKKTVNSESANSETVNREDSLYFLAPGVKQGVKRSENLQGTRIFRFGPLFFSQNCRIFKNVQNSTQNDHFGAVF